MFTNHLLNTRSCRIKFNAVPSVALPVYLYVNPPSVPVNQVPTDACQGECTLPDEFPTPPTTIQPRNPLSVPVPPSNQDPLAACQGVKRTLSETFPTPPSKISRLNNGVNPSHDTSTLAVEKEIKFGDDTTLLDKMMKENKKMKRSIKTLKQQLKRKVKKIKTMNQMLSKIKSKMLIKTAEAELLQNNFDGMKLSLFTNALKNSQGSSTGRRYSDKIKEFALTLHFYSPKAYKYVRSIMPLPHPSLIRKWACSLNCEPGFLSESFNTLAEEAKVKPENQDCRLVATRYNGHTETSRMGCCQQ